MAQEKTRVALNVRENASFSDVVDILENAQVAGTGFEPPNKNTGETPRRGEGGAESGALGAHSTPIDPDLQAIIEAWPKLNESTKAGILATVRASRDG